MKKDFIYLASASPRRSELLRQIGVRFEVRPAEIPEDLAPGEAPEAYVLRLAAAKAAVVWSALDAAHAEPRPVLAADTAVVLDGRVLGKPANAVEAEAMLEQLSGRAHDVLTAVSLRCGSQPETLLASAEVRFRATTLAERRAYCATGEPFDKAGGYAIQDAAFHPVARIEGCECGVMGLPLWTLRRLLHDVGIEASTPALERCAECPAPR